MIKTKVWTKKIISSLSSGKPSLKAPDKNRSVSMQKEKENINPSSWQVGV